MDSLETNLSISEIFISIQGEGKHIGTPSIFIRTSGCNLRCQWDQTLCDTPYTSWYPEHKSVKIIDVLKKVKRIKSKYPFTNHIVITGGEPLLQKNITILIDELAKLGFFLSLETNGTLALPLNIDFVSISPKLKSSIPFNQKFESIHEKLRYNKNALLFWHINYSYQLKFVVNRNEDEQEILWILADLKIEDRTNIYLMPQGITPKELVKNSKKCIEIGRRNGWKYSPRVHIDIYGNVRGV